MGAQSAHYLFSVRRFKVGDEINIFDGLGKSYTAQITKISKTSVEGKIISDMPFIMPKYKIVLYSAIPKGDRFEWLVEKAAELGIYKIVPLITNYSVTKTFSSAKLERFNKISIAASSQSGRADIMPVADPVSFTDAIKTDGLKIMALETEDKQSLFKLLTKEVLTDTINIFIGPEGGFTESEVAAALNTGVKPVTLGKNILRVETAAVTAAALTLNIVENLCS